MKRAVVGLLLLSALAAWWWGGGTPDAPVAVDAGTPMRVEAPPVTPALEAPEALDASEPAPPAEEASLEGLSVRVLRDDLCTDDGGDDVCEVPVEGVHVTVHAQPVDGEDGGWHVTGRTNARGEVEVPDAGAEFEYRAEVVDDAWFSNPVTFDYSGGPQAMVLMASPYSTFELRVRDPSGHPVPRAHFVVLLGAGGDLVFEGDTDAHGEYRTAKAPTGRGELEVHAEGFPDFLDSNFVLQGRIEREVTLATGREVFVRVERADAGIPLVVTLSASPAYGHREPLAPGAPGARFTKVPAKTLTATVSEPGALFGALTAAAVPAGATEVALRLEGAPLVVQLEGAAPKTVWASGKCCAPHHVTLRCDGFPLRRMATNAQPGSSVRFEYVPPVPCWVKYDDGPEQRAWPPSAIVRMD